LAAKRREVKKLDIKIAKLNGEVSTLRQEKAETEASIRALRTSALTEIERVSQTALETLRAQKAETEGSIKALKASALNEMKQVSQTGVEKVDKSAEAINSSVQAIGGTALRELKEALSLVDELGKRAVEVGAIIGQLETKLDKSKELRERTERLVTGIQAGI
jgi:chromosome segregation ATPase